MKNNVSGPEKKQERDSTADFSEETFPIITRISGIW